jgi:hypothetical protein
LITIDTDYNVAPFVGGWSGNTWVATTSTPSIVTPVGISINPIKVDYLVGESFNQNDISVSLVYSNQTTLVLDPLDYSVSGFSSLLGTHTVTVTYLTFSNTYEIYVTSSEVTILSVEVIYSGAKVNYYKGEPYSSSGLSLLAHYSDSSSHTVGITSIVGGSTDILGAISVSVYHDDLFDTYTINVSQMTVSYYFGETLEATDEIDYASSSQYPNFVVVDSYIKAWYTDSLFSTIYSGDLTNITSSLVLYAKIVSRTKFIFDITIPLTYLPAPTSYLVHYYGPNVNTGNGTIEYGVDDHFMVLSVSGSVASTFIELDHEGDIAGFEFLFDQNSLRKKSNWLVFDSSYNNTTVTPIYVNSWLGSEFLLTMSSANIKTLSINATFLTTYSPTVYWLRVDLSIGGIVTTVNLQGSSTEGSDNIVLAITYSVTLVAELNIDFVQIWFCQYEGGHQHKGSSQITWANISSSPIIGATWLGSVWTPTYGV